MKNTSLLIFYSMIILFVGCSQENNSIDSVNPQTNEEIIINTGDIDTDANEFILKNLYSN